MIIDLRQLKGGSAELRGTAESDIFELGERDSVRVAAPHDYDLRVVDEDGILMVSGLLRGHFHLTCARCLEGFRHEAVVPGFFHSEPIEGRATIDLTSAVREDILLALPPYPRCDKHGERPRCPAAALLDHSKRGSGEDASGSTGAWEALEDWTPKN